METMVWAVRWDEWCEDAEPALRGLLPPPLTERIGARCGAQRQQTLAAYGLLRYGVARVLGMHGLPELCYGGLGKPAFAAYPGVHFNLSHTAGLALCAFAGVPVGVDAEKIRPVTAERAARLQLPGEPTAFFQGWVERESRIKCRGGSVLQCRGAVEPEAGERYHPLEELLPDYAAGVCVLAEKQVHLELLSMTDLF